MLLKERLITVLSICYKASVVMHSCCFVGTRSCWQACLDSVTDTVRQNASRWWFHIYNLLVPYISPLPVRVHFSLTDGLLLFLILLMT